MTILIADDISVNRKLLHELLIREGYKTHQAVNGLEALAYLRAAKKPVVGMIDWQMPEMDGIDVCRQARLIPNAPPMFLFLLTVRDSKEDIVTGLQAGANDYMTKPFHRDELVARVKIGVEMVTLQQALIDQVQELRNALADVKRLSGLLPICGFCKKIRDDSDYWQQVEEYISQHSEAKLSHSICPQCFEAYVKPQIEQLGPSTKT